MNLQIFPFLAVTLLGACVVSGFTTAPTHIVTAPTADFITEVAIVDENGRMTEEEYAKAKGVSLTQVQNRFAATGILNRDGYRGSAQLTADRQTITTVAHMFTDKDTCRPLNSPSSCVFTIKNGARVETIKVKELAATGFKCPELPRGADDWAVARLRRPATLANPYRVSDLDSIEPRVRVISVSAGTIDFKRRRAKDGTIEYPKSIEECETKHLYRTFGRPTLYTSNCDFSSGNSGGSILRETTDGDILFAISAANSEPERERTAILNGREPKSAPYKENVWTTYHVPIGGDFLNAVRRAADKMPAPATTERKHGLPSIPAEPGRM
jgi:hypothetical protein